MWDMLWGIGYVGHAMGVGYVGHAMRISYGVHAIGDRLW